MTANADPPGDGLSLAEWAVLALLCEGDAHGWLLVRALAPEGEIGSIWTVRRALVYRSINGLEGRGLIVAAGSEASARGPERTIYSADARGRAAVRAWFGKPVEHVRDLRSALLLKLVLGRRAGVDSLRSRRRSPPGGAHAADTEALLLRFRLETTRAATRFVEGELKNEGRPTGGGGGLRSKMAE